MPIFYPRIGEGGNGEVSSVEFRSLPFSQYNQGHGMARLHLVRADRRLLRASIHLVRGQPHSNGLEISATPRARSLTYVNSPRPAESGCRTQDVPPPAVETH